MAHQEGELIVCGITDYAQDSLSDIVYVEMPEVGAVLNKGEAFGGVESVEASNDLYMPLDGKIVEVNEALKNEPELVNDDPFGAGWMIKFKPINPGQWDSLLSGTEYEKVKAEKTENNHREVGEKSIEELIDALNNSDAFVRMDAAFALGQRRDKRAVEYLISMLKDEHSYVRRDAALALGEIKDERAVKPLINAYKANFEAPVAKAIWMITGKNIEEELFLSSDQPTTSQCASCGTKFSTAPPDTGTPVGQLIGQGGMHCRACGKRFCIDCASKDSSGTLICTCGTNLVPYGM